VGGGAIAAGRPEVVAAAARTTGRAALAETTRVVVAPDAPRAQRWEVEEDSGPMMLRCFFCFRRLFSCVWY